MFDVDKKTINKKVIKDFLVINCTGKNNLIGLKTDNNFFIEKFQTNIKNNNDLIVNNITNFLKKNNVKIDKNFSIIVNLGPGSFSSIRTALAVAKGIQISKKAKLYGYKSFQLTAFSLKNIEILISKNLLQNKLIKPVYLS